MKILASLFLLVLLYNGTNCQSWQQAAGIPDTLWIYDLAAYDDYVFAATMYGIYRSGDAGKNWEPKNSGIDPELTAARAFARSGNIIFVSNFRGVFCTTDYGENWTNLNLPHENPSLSVFADDSIVLAGVTGGGLYRSTDYGASWTPVSGDHHYKMAKFGNYYFSGSWFDVLVSDDYGITWNPSGLNDMTYWVINFNDSIYGCPFGGGIAKTTPEPINWAFDPGISFPINGITAANDTLYVISNDYIFYDAENNPETSWVEIPNNNLPLTEGNYLWCIAISGNNILVGTRNNDGTGAGVWYYPFYQIPDAINSEASNDRNALFFPNPAKDFINLRNTDKIVKIEVYTLTGTRVFTALHPNNIIDISNLSPGIYVIKSETDQGRVADIFVKQ